MTKTVIKYISAGLFSLILLTGLGCLNLYSQNTASTDSGKAENGSVFVYKMPKTGNFMHYKVENGDTIYIGSLRPAYSFGAMKGKDWRQYARLVRNFAKVYPYSILARQLVVKADSTFKAGSFSRRQKDKYVNDLQKKIFVSYEQTARNMTISQGQLMMRLIDREVGKSSYDIIKLYKSGIAAGFWQGLAKVFGTDMKKHYDPDGEDRDTEELIKKWQRGEFPDFYFSIFGEYPSIPETPENLK